MQFKDIQVGDEFSFVLPVVVHPLVDAKSSTAFRKVSNSTYTYGSDKNAVWKFYTPPYTKVEW